MKKMTTKTTIIAVLAGLTVTILMGFVTTAIGLDGLLQTGVISMVAVVSSLTTVQYLAEDKHEARM